MIKKIFIILSLLLISTYIFSAVPPLINYQGKLLDSSGSPVPDSTYSIRFRIYNVETGDNAIPCGDPGANCLWEETQSVQTKNGIYNVLLGSINPLTADIFSEADRWLGLTVVSDSEMTPRQKFASSAYALKIDSTSGGGYIQKAVSTIAIPPTTTDWDITYVDIDFSEGELKANDLIEAKVLVETNSGVTDEYVKLQLAIRNVTTPGGVTGIVTQINSVQLVIFYIVQQKEYTDYISAPYTWMQVGNIEGSSGEHDTDDANVFETAWTLRLNFRNHKLVTGEPASAKYWVYIIKGSE